MDFFKSVFTDDPPPSKSAAAAEEDPDNQNPNPSSPYTTSSWSFGVLVKTLTTRSESVLQTYRRDLEEFSSELKKETSAIRDAASRSIGDLDIGSSVLRGILSVDRDRDSPLRNARFEERVLEIQSDPSTYCEGFEDFDEFKKWKLGFSMEEKKEEIENLCGKNGIMESIYRELVPDSVNHETFWIRYFYRIDKLKKVEDERSDLARRAMISKQGEENVLMESKDEISGTRELENTEIVEKRSNCCQGSLESNGGELIGEVKEKLVLEGKVEAGDELSNKKNGNEEDDIGWDEIEDLGSNDEKKGSGYGGNSIRVEDLRRRLSAVDVDEDLSWDIGDDEPAKQ